MVLDLMRRPTDAGPAAAPAVTWAPIGNRKERFMTVLPAAAGVAVRSDGLLAVLATVVAVVRLARQPVTPSLFGWVLVCAATMVLVWRHRTPLLVLATCAGCFFVYQALGYPQPGLPYALLIAAYTVATTRAAAVAAMASAAAMLAAAASKMVHEGWSPANFDDTLISYLLSICAVCALGYGVQLSRTRTELLHQQAARLAVEHAAHEMHNLQRQRHRIARDLHDVVSHQVTLITALAAGAGAMIDAHPERARHALSSIETAGRDALNEMRRLLHVLRPDGDGAGRSPQPGLADLPDLVDQTRGAGLPVELHTHGTSRPLPPGVELCAYRIVQEALTNTLKHAGPASAVVDVSYEPDALDLQIRDTGRGMATRRGTGNGLSGMRERTALVGGHLELDSDPGQGMRVHARLPLDGSSP